MKTELAPYRTGTTLRHKNERQQHAVDTLKLWPRKDQWSDVSWKLLHSDLPADQATLAQRKASAPLKPTAPQAPMDVGLFSDDATQLDLIEMLMEPTND